MANVRFRNIVVRDDRWMLHQENAIERTLAFSGVHDTDALNWISEAFSVTTSDVSDDLDFAGQEGTWEATGGVLQGTGGGAAQWYKIRHTTETEIGFVVTFDKTGDRGGFICCSNTSYASYLVWWKATCVGISELDGTTETVLISVPLTETGASTVTIAARPKMYSSVDEIEDIELTLWFDDRLLVSYTLHYAEKGDYIGFAVYQSDTITFDDLDVAQLHKPVEWTSVDPGEAASAGLSRVVGQDDIRLLARYDGTVKMWRNVTTTVDWTVPQGKPIEARQAKQFYTPSHLRLVGALHETNTFRDDGQGHIFAVGQDPNALSESETYDRGVRMHRRMEEEGTQVTLRLAPNPVLEPEDVIEIDGDSWRVVTVAYTIQWRGGQGSAPVLESTITARECLS